jgi:3',5'-cyclic AMP phosphodiesterase CpdA
MAHRVRWTCLLAALALTAGCKRYIRIDDPQRLEYQPADAESVRRWRQDLGADLAAGPLSLRIAGEAPAPGWTVVTRFVHVSDVQVRDRAIRYFTRKREKLVATVASATYRNEELDSSDEFPFLALVGGVNARVDQGSEAPDFLVHTGDAADANSLGELLRFVAVANGLKVPWFDVVGNHDLFLMGNFTEDHLVIEGAPSGGLPWVLNRARFMETHGANGTVPASHPPTEAPTGGRVPGSRYHGFDCLAPGCTTCGGGVPALRPYYSVLLGTTPPIRLVVLDTTLPHERVPRIFGGELPAVGASGYVDAEQFRWLQSELADAHDAGQAVIVFGHHPLTVEHETFGFGPLRGTNPEGKADEPVLDLLKAERNVLGYFGGHTHVARIARHADPYRGAHGFYEVIAPSLHEYPQSAYWVEVLRRGDELALRVRPLQPVAAGNPVIRERVAQACAGARVHAKLAPQGDCASDEGILDAAVAARVPPAPGATRAVARAGQDVDCGSLFLNASVECEAPGAAAARDVDVPLAVSVTRRAGWKGEKTCEGGDASVAYGATCTIDGPRRVELALASTLRARLGAAAAEARRARGEVAPQWTVPLQVGPNGAKVRIDGPPASALACRARVDALAEAPIGEKAEWAIASKGEHTLVVSCAAVEAACRGAAACDVGRKLEASFAVTVE